MISYLTSVDAHVLQALYAMREPHTVLAFIWVSELGSALTVVGLSLALALWLTLKRHFALAQGILLSVATSGVAALLIKTAVGRARPPASFWAYTESGYSFPSGHSTLSMAFYGFLAYMVWRSNASPLWRRASLIGALLIVLIVGFSRLYLGVHYLSDVFGGYVLGAACVWLAAWTTNVLERRYA